MTERDDDLLILFTGNPAQTSPAGMFFHLPTNPFVATTAPSPMVTPGWIVVPAPIKQPFFKVTLAKTNWPFSTRCPLITERPPITTLSSIGQLKDR